MKTNKMPLDLVWNEITDRLSREDAAEKRISKKDAERVLCAYGDMCKTMLTDPEPPFDSIMLPGIGRLVLVTRKAHLGRNPRTGESVQVPEMKSVKLVLSREMKTAFKNQ